ncbi:MAG: YcxB family protein [Oscillospiraceae bacterium]|nr:YcxB family protein [Oscillospiraceae bacterium]
MMKFEFEVDVSYKMRESNKRTYTALFAVALMFTVPNIFTGIGFIISGIGSGNLSNVFNDSGLLAITLAVIMFMIVTPLLILRLAIKFWKSELQCRYIFREDKMIIVNRDGSETEQAYSGITMVTEETDRYMIYIDKYHCYILPKISLTEISHEEFSEFIIRKTNMRIQRKG